MGHFIQFGVLSCAMSLALLKPATPSPPHSTSQCLPALFEPLRSPAVRTPSCHTDCSVSSITAFSHHTHTAGHNNTLIHPLARSLTSSPTGHAAGHLGSLSATSLALLPALVFLPRINIFFGARLFRCPSPAPPIPAGWLRSVRKKFYLRTYAIAHVAFPQALTIITSAQFEERVNSLLTCHDFDSAVCRWPLDASGNRGW